MSQDYFQDMSLQKILFNFVPGLRDHYYSNYVAREAILVKLVICFANLWTRTNIVYDLW